jgi:hypothetical protein
VIQEVAMGGQGGCVSTRWVGSRMPAGCILEGVSRGGWICVRVYAGLAGTQHQPALTTQARMQSVHLRQAMHTALNMGQ